MPLKAVIFDLDGTITQPFLDFDAIRRDMGYPSDAGPILELMKKMTRRQRDEAQRILLRHEQKAVTASLLNPGVRETLDELRSRRIFTGILTRNTRVNAMAVADKHDLKFDAVVGREQGPAKPDPFGVLHLCGRFGIVPRESLVVGDYLDDLLCARAAGAVSVLLKNHHQAEEFARHADFVVENIPDILPILADRRSRSSTKEGPAERPSP